MTASTSRNTTAGVTIAHDRACDICEDHCFYLLRDEDEAGEVVHCCIDCAEGDDGIGENEDLLAAFKAHRTHECAECKAARGGM